MKYKGTLYSAFGKVWVYVILLFLYVFRVDCILCFLTMAKSKRASFYPKLVRTIHRRNGVFVSV